VERKNIKKYTIVILGLILSALSFDLFLAPLKIVVGGTNGLSILVGEILNISPSTFTITDGEIEEFDKNICKLSLKGTSSDPDITVDGHMINRSTLLLVNVQSDVGVKGNSTGWNFCEQLVRDLTRVFHKTYTREDGVKSVYIDSIRLRGNINKTGLNPQAVYCFSINFIFNYVELI